MRLTCILHYFAISVHLLALVPRVTAPLPAPHRGEGGAQLPSCPASPAARVKPSRSTGAGACSTTMRWMKRRGKSETTCWRMRWEMMVRMWFIYIDCYRLYYSGSTCCFCLDMSRWRSLDVWSRCFQTGAKGKHRQTLRWRSSEKFGT